MDKEKAAWLSYIYAGIAEGKVLEMNIGTDNNPKWEKMEFHAPTMASYKEMWRLV